MTSATFFVRDCPACGRKLQVRVNLLGRDVECSHCGAVFNTTNRDPKRDADLKIERVLAEAKKFLDSSELVNPAPAKGG
jgi:ribosomal protein L37AE/L43A